MRNEKTKTKKKNETCVHLPHGANYHLYDDTPIGTFKELGAPDLCHIIKVNVKPNVKEVSV